MKRRSADLRSYESLVWYLSWTSRDDITTRRKGIQPITHLMIFSYDMMPARMCINLDSAPIIVTVAGHARTPIKLTALSAPWRCQRASHHVFSPNFAQKAHKAKIQLCSVCSAPVKSHGSTNFETSLIDRTSNAENLTFSLLQ